MVIIILLSTWIRKITQFIVSGSGSSYARGEKSFGLELKLNPGPLASLATLLTISMPPMATWKSYASLMSRNWCHSENCRRGRKSCLRWTNRCFSANDRLHSRWTQLNVMFWSLGLKEKPFKGSSFGTNEPNFRWTKSLNLFNFLNFK